VASFLIVLGTGEQKLVSSQKKTLRIGRLPDSEILVDEPVISRRHAEIYRSDSTYYVQDTGSRNGTLVNGKRISQPTVIAPGDVIGVGNCRIIFEPTDSFSFLKERGAAAPSSTINLAAPSTPKKMMAPLVLLETVADIARRIVQDKPLEGILDSILKLCVDKTHAERAAIMLLNEKKELVPRAYLSRARTHAKFAISRSIAQKAIDENQAILIKDVAGDDNLKMSESIASLSIRSAICTPLWNGECTVGVLYVDTTEPDHQFAEIDLLFFSTLSGMIAEKIENAILADIAKDKQRLDAELTIATEIQNGLFPSDIPEISGYDLSAFNRPCTEVGGDYYDIIDLGGRIGIAIADVAGKGIGAAMLMSNLQALLRLRATEISDPAELLTKLNSDLVGRVGESRFITCFYLVLDPVENKIRYSNAGHNPPMLCCSGSVVSVLEVSGMPLGILPDISYETSETDIGSGDVLLLYSDGITECMNKAGDLFGEVRLKDVLIESYRSDAHGVRGAIFSAVDTFRQEEPYSDDMTLIVLKRLKS
jgi:serine phosphatase RsbU (regulator of sigma subunit)/pSer/pThr/pTyr-binding forkhead associated (FHA) protein